LVKVVYTKESPEDFDRIFAFHAAEDSATGVEMVDRITEVIERLADHPYLGRPAEEGTRELVISKGKTGFIALYDYIEGEDAIVILAIRHQLEEGYPER
jgi:plasmid stabilization system protein ParE